MSERKPVWARCGRCDWRYIVAYIPAPIDGFSTALSRAICPACFSTQAFLGDGPQGYSGPVPPPLEVVTWKS